ELRQSRGNLGQLHQAGNALHHARAAGCGDDDEGRAGFVCAIDGASNGFAHNSTHRAADKAVLHRRDNYIQPVDLADSIHDGVVQPGLLLRLLQACLVGLQIGEAQRVGRAQVAVYELIARVEEHVDALPGAYLEVVAAVGTDLEIGLKICIPDGLAALRALGPEALGSNLVVGGRDNLVRVALEPGHRSSSLV